MLLVSDHELGARRQVAAAAIRPFHLVLPRRAAVFAGQQDRVRYIAIHIDEAAEVDLAFGERGNLDLLHGFSWMNSKKRGAIQAAHQMASRYPRAVMLARG